jgi:hypothetical protein
MIVGIRQEYKQSKQAVHRVCVFKSQDQKIRNVFSKNNPMHSKNRKNKKIKVTIKK